MNSLPIKTRDVPSRIAVLVRAALPGAAVGGLDRICHEHAMAQPGKVVDVGGRGVASVDDAQPGLRLKPLAQRRPATGVARHPGPGKARGRSGGTALLLLAEPTLEQLKIPRSEEH